MSTRSQRRSSPARSWKLTVVPPKRPQDPRPDRGPCWPRTRSGTPASLSARAVRTPCFPAPMTSARRPSSRGDPDGRAPPRPMRPRPCGGRYPSRSAHACRPVSVLEEAVDDRPAGAERQREIVRTPDLSLDLGLAEHHRVEPRRHPEDMTYRIRPPPRPDRPAELLAVHPAARREFGDDGTLRAGGVTRHEIDIRAIARGQSDAASSIPARSASDASRTAARRASSSTRSRSASGAVRCVTPRRRGASRPDLIMRRRRRNQSRHHGAVGVRGSRRPDCTREPGEHQGEGGACG